MNATAEDSDGATLSVEEARELVPDVDDIVGAYDA